jgi:molecular chaperone GrpE
MNKKKKTTTAELKEKLEELEEKWKRALADYDNLRKRVEKERSDLVKFSSASLIDKLLFVIDSLEKCLDHLKDKGLELTLEQFKKILESEGLEEIKAQGKKFDPEKMDAVEVVKGKKDIVVEVVLKGYYLNKRVLRPAKVKVGQG